MTGATRPDHTERWCADLLLELRLRDVPGDRIGAVLAEVRDHLASSVEDPLDAFGPAKEYAGVVAASRPRVGWGRRVARVLGNAAGLAGLLWMLEGGTAALSGEQAALTEMQLVLPVLVAVAAPALVVAVVRARGLAVLGWGVVVSAVLATVGVLEARFGPVVELTVPAVAVLVPGALVAVAWIAATSRTVDPVSCPLEPAAAMRSRRLGVGAVLAASMLAVLLAPLAVFLAVGHLG